MIMRVTTTTKVRKVRKTEIIWHSVLHVYIRTLWYLCFDTSEFNMKRILIVFASVLVIGCVNGNGGLRNGDLIFVGLPEGYDAQTGSMDDAILSATGDQGWMNLIHVAIAEVKADSVWIIDATIAHGVDRHPLDTFLTDFTLKDGSYPAFIVKRVKGIDADAAVDRAKTFCGRAYDVRFLPDNEDLYCSELVQKCYLDAKGNPVFSSAPMNWLASDGTMPPYWEWLFGQLGMEVPQGLPGTNPQGMSEAGCLVDVPAAIPIP